MRSIITAVLATLAVVLSATAPVNAADAATTSPSTLLLGLNGVSCVSARFCAAAGSQGDSAHLSRGDVPLTMIWNGSRWRKTATPLPRGWTEGELDSVSCVSPRYCVAIGEYNRGSYEYALAETWNGRTWTAARLPRPSGGFGHVGGAVSCGAARNCLAVLSFDSATPGVREYYGILRGTKWSLHVVTGPKGAGFAGVSCVSATHCVLAGNYVTKRVLVLFETWNGKTFTPMKAPTPAGTGLFIAGVSCASAKSCAAVGSAGPPIVQAANASFAELWNGKAWSVASVPRPRGLGTNLYGISCGSPASCVAVGVAATDGSEGTSHPLADSYDGRSWTTASMPALHKGRGNGQFQGVSCVSAVFCVAVGEGGGSGGNFFSNAALTGFWNGKSWKLVTAS
jgi:hypothetical protein